MTTLAEYEFPTEVIETVGPLTPLFERGLRRCAEVSIASLTLWVLEGLEQHRLKPEMADQIFTLLDVYLTDHIKDFELSDLAQELIFEGEHFHHFGGEWGPNPEHLRELASQILDAVEKG